MVSSNVARTKRQFGRKLGTHEAGYTGRGGCGRVVVGGWVGAGAGQKYSRRGGGSKKRKVHAEEKDGESALRERELSLIHI